LQVHTLFFASYRDLVGTGEMSLEVPDGCTVSQLVGALRERGRPFDRLPADPARQGSRSASPIVSRPVSSGKEARASLLVVVPKAPQAGPKGRAT